MITLIALIAAGLALLILAGDLLVRGAVNLATMLKISPLIVGLTVVAFGTSAPELMVTLQGVSSGNYHIAMGNIVGSNIANVLLVLGLPALIYPFITHLPGLKKDAIALIIGTSAFMGFVYFRGVLDQLTALALLGLLIIYIFTLFLRARNSEGAEVVLDEIEDYAAENGIAWKTPLFILAGIIGLPLGAKLLVDNGSALAEMLHVRQELIGLTIVAIGTSLPELATVVAAALRKQADVAVGNVVGSNLFNLLFVGGAAGLVGQSYFSADARLIDIPIMALSSLLLIFLILTHRKISRVLGVAMFLLYVGYIGYISYTSTPAL